jgi:hypothetical protein
VAQQPLLLPTPVSQAPQEASISLEGLSSKKDIRNTSDGVDVVDTYDISENTKQAIRNSHNMGKRFLESRNYPRAAVAYHKMKKRSESQFWLERALDINPDYEPAKKFKRMFF